MLAYLQLVDNPDFNPAFIRAVKVPARGAGDKVSYSTRMTPDDRPFALSRWKKSLQKQKSRSYHNSSL
jgi:superfamily I DNA/RNA helicase